MKKIFFLMISFLGVVAAQGQGYVSYEYLTGSKMRDEIGNKYGSGNMSMTSIGINMPLYTKVNERGQATAWSAGLSGSYARLSNQGEACSLTPSEIVNTGVNLMHIRPISQKWSIMAALGAGVYAPIDEMRGRSILGNGGVLFICRLNSNLSLGAGAGVSNSFGVPMAMPMLYLRWSLNKNNIAFNIEMTNSIKLGASMGLSKRITIEAVPLEIDGLTAVTSATGKDEIFSMMMLRSLVECDFHLSEKFSLFASIGGNWIRGISRSERSLKGLFDSFKDDNEDDPYFQAALRMSSGIKFRF